MSRLDALSACGEDGATTVGEGGTAEPTADGVVPLAKALGWRPELGSAGTPFAVLEVAFDRAAAEAAWEDNVPDDLPDSSGAPAEPGVYGDIDGVDFDRQVVTVWSSGESGSCLSWLADVRAHDDGTVELVRRDTASLESTPAAGEGVFVACTDDYRPYRMVLAVDRDRTPDMADLPTENVAGVPDGRVVAYPASD